MSKLKFAILGCGRISYKHVETLINNRPEVELVEVYDIIRDKAVTEKTIRSSSSSQYPDTQAPATRSQRRLKAAI